MTRFVIWDLDGTVIDSTHRGSIKPDGTGCLDTWFANARPENIARDSLLPLARIMRIMHKAGMHNIICTARCLQDADRQFLIDNDLPSQVILSRRHDGFCPITNRPINSDESGDADMKIRLLSDYFKSLGFWSIREARAMMFDDNQKVLDRLAREGITMIDAVKANANLLRNEETERAIAA